MGVWFFIRVLEHIQAGLIVICGICIMVIISCVFLVQHLCAPDIENPGSCDDFVGHLFVCLGVHLYICMLIEL